LPDLATIATALSSIKTATEIAKLIKSGEKSLEQAEYKLKVAELVGALADAKIEIAGIQDIILEKDKKISSLEERFNLRESMVWEKPYYWKKSTDQKDGPFCQQCFDNEQKAIRLQGEDGAGVWTCNTCKVTVTDRFYSDQM
jgi:ribosomal protein L37AE/L43A